MRRGAGVPRSLTRRRLLASGAALLASPLAGCGARPPVLRVGANDWPGYRFLQIAVARQLAGAGAVRTVAMPSATATLRALAAGNIELAGLTLDELLAARADGLDLVAVAVIDTSHGADVLLARPGVDSLAALAGRRIGVEQSAVGALMLDAALGHAGLPATAVEVVYATLDEHLDGYRSGRFDAVISFEPVAGALAAAGARRLFDSSAVPGRIVDLLVARRDQLGRRDAALRGIVAGHYAALADWRRDPAGTTAWLAATDLMEPERAARLFDGIRMIDPVEARDWMQGAPSRLQRQAELLSELMVRARLLPRVPELAAIGTADFLP